jgi:hypothetical protein
MNVDDKDVSNHLMCRIYKLGKVHTNLFVFSYL